MRFSVPDVKRSDIAYSGQCIVIDSGCDYFGNGTPFATTVNSPSWSQLMKIATQAQKVTGNQHHDFFEGIDAIAVINDVPVFRLMLGS